MEKTVNVARNRLILAAGAALVAAAAHAASIVPPENLGELAQSSDAVVLAQAGAPRGSQRGVQAFTLTAFRGLGGGPSCPAPGGGGHPAFRAPGRHPPGADRDLPRDRPAAAPAGGRERQG